jgi:hypothetical protein
MTTAHGNSIIALNSADRPGQRARVERLIRDAGDRGLADFELQHLLFGDSPSKSESKISASRRGELVMGGCVFDSGTSRKRLAGDDGLGETVWIHRIHASQYLIGVSDEAARRAMDAADAGESALNELQVALDRARGAQRLLDIGPLQRFAMLAIDHLPKIMAAAREWNLQVRRLDLPQLVKEAGEYGWPEDIVRRITAKKAGRKKRKP